MRTERKITAILMTIYLVVLTWIILFKMGTVLDNLGEFRSVNLLPYGESAIVNEQVDFSEIIYNIAAFLPIGIYVSMLRPRWSFWRKLLPAAGISLGYEILQYLLGIGATDITHWINNTLGALVGILLYLAAYRLWKQRTNIVLLGFSALCTVLFLGLLCLLVFWN